MTEIEAIKLRAEELGFFLFTSSEIDSILAQIEYDKNRINEMHKELLKLGGEVSLLLWGMAQEEPKISCEVVDLNKYKIMKDK